MHYILKAIYHLSVILDKYGAHRVAEKCWLKLKNSPDENISSLAYTSVGERYLKDMKYDHALCIYQESMTKLEGTPGDGKQCHGATLVRAAFSALHLNKIDLVDEYLVKVKNMTELEEWILAQAEQVATEKEKMYNQSSKPT